jgi:hypothetical protein
MLLLLAIACAPHVMVLETPVDTVGVQPLAHHRRVYGNARPGSADALHNAAVAAEQVGDLAEAVALAREAYVAEPDRRRHRYVQLLEGRLVDVGGIAALP